MHKRVSALRNKSSKARPRAVCAQLDNSYMWQSLLRCSPYLTGRALIAVYRVWLCVGLISLFWLFLDSPAQESTTKYWVFFKDKGFETQKRLEEAYALAKGQLTPRSLRRRAKVRSRENLLDYTDLPVNPKYIEAVKDLGFEPIVVSKWLNAVSIRATSEEMRRIRSFPFVKKVQRVAIFIRKPVSKEETENLSKTFQGRDKHDHDYGPSYTQNALIRVPEVHDMGINGQGVLIAMLDTGFNYKQHEAFQNLKVIAEYDFINRDSVTANEADQDVSYQHDHGSMTLSVIGGFKEGKLIGPAYGARFVLAKTEYVPTETRIEEDYWVAGIEWADSLGADIVSSSLGYLDWYTYQDMDGNTAVTTIAADLAAKKGIIVVTSAGNERAGAWYYITAPADGDSVIAVGAVYSNGQITSFSSAGPTYDGRIKPDVVALGARVYAILPNSYNEYTSNFGGTSASCPQVAGVCALILSGHPELTPMQVREALRMTASRAYDPDNFYGWGLVDAYKAIHYFGKPTIPRICDLYQNYPNPFNVVTTIAFDLLDNRRVVLKVFNVLGQEVITLRDEIMNIKRGHLVTWDGKDSKGRPSPSGVYFYRLQVGAFTETKKMLLVK